MPRGKPKDTERVLETPEDVVYEALRTALALRGVETVSKRADAGLRLIAEVTAREVARRVRTAPVREKPRGPTAVFREIVSERPGIEREDLIRLAMERVDTTSTDPRNTFLNILNRASRRYGYLIERGGRYYPGEKDG